MLRWTSVCVWLAAVFVGHSFAKSGTTLDIKGGGIVVGEFNYFGLVEDLPNIARAGSYSLAEIDDKGVSMTPLIIADGDICVVVGGPDKQIFVGGSFSSLNGLPCSNIGIYQHNGDVSCIELGLDGDVYSILVNDIDDGYQLFIGGSFNRPVGVQYTDSNYMNSIISYQSDKSGGRWIPFSRTVNDAVYSIVFGPNNQLLIGGAFDSWADVTVPPTQLVVSPSVNVTASDTADGSSPSNAVDGSLQDDESHAWLLPNNTGGSLIIDLGIFRNVRQVRLANTRYQDRGTTKFTVGSYGGSVWTMDYFNYFTGTEGAQCSTFEYCPLFLYPYVDFQNYTLPGSGSVSVRYIEICIKDYVGIGGGLREVQILADDIIVDNEFNSAGASISKVKGSWSTQGLSSDDYGTYLCANLTNSDAELKIYPVIPVSGVYCLELGTGPCDICAEEVTVSVYFEAGKDPAVINANTLTYPYVIGTFDFVLSSGFQPYVDISMKKSAGESLFFDYITFSPAGSTDNLYYFAIGDMSTLEISPFNVLDSGADCVTTILPFKDWVILGGYFSHAAPNAYNNIVAYDYTANTPTAIPLDWGGLDDEVCVLLDSGDGDTFYVGGCFSSTWNATSELFLKGIAKYSVSQNQWSPVGGGVDGDVGGLSLSDSSLIVTGGFSKVYSSVYDSQGQSAQNYAVFDTSSQTFTPYSASDYLETLTIDKTLYIWGDINSPLSTSANGVALMKDGYWQPLANGFSDDANSLFIQSNPYIASMQYMGNDIYVGGYFGGVDYVTTTRYVAVYKDDQWQGVSNGFDGRVNVLTEVNGVLFAGGSFTKSFNETSLGYTMLNGLARRKGGDWVPVGDLLSPGAYISAHVNAIVWTKLNDAVVGGSFNSAGMETDCQNICYFDGKNWRPMDRGVDGEVYTIVEHDGSFYIGGSFDMAGCLEVSNYVIWDGDKWVFPDLGNLTTLPNPIRSIAVDTKHNIFLLDEDNNLYQHQRLKNKTWIVTQINGNPIGGNIYSMQILSASHAPSQDSISRGSVLVFTGYNNINICGVTGSVVYWDGSDWYAYGISNGAVANIYPEKNYRLAAWQIALIAVGVFLFVLLLVLIVVLLWMKRRKRNKGGSKSSEQSSAAPPPRPRSAAPGFVAGGGLPMESKQRVRAKFDFNANEAGEVSFKEGDIIMVTDSSNADWWQGEVNGQHGTFPADYVEPA